MTPIQPSPVSPMDAEEYAWLTGKLWYVESQRKYAPLEHRAYDYFAPPEFDPQHSCRHGSTRGDESRLYACHVCCLAAAACTLIAFVCGLAAIVGAMWRELQ